MVFVPGPQYNFEKGITNGRQKISDDKAEKLTNFVKSEFNECADSFEYFCEKYIMIYTIKKQAMLDGINKRKKPQSVRTLFKLRGYQKRAYRDFEKHRFNIVKKCRQLGLSTLVAAYILWKCLFNSGYQVVIISIGDREAKEVLKKIKKAYDHLKLDPEIAKLFGEGIQTTKTIETVIKGKTVKNDQHEIEWDNGSRVVSLPSTAGRSYTCSLLVLDEAAFCKNISELWAGVYPTLSTGGDCIVISTTNKTVGIGKWYYDTWIKAESHENDFNVIDIKWFENPDFDEAWLESMYRNLGAERFKQEVLGLFLVGGDTVFPGALIEKYEYNAKDPILKKEMRELWIWDPPRPDGNYAMMVDTSGDEGNACSAFEIFDLDTMEQVVEYRTKTYTGRFARIIYKWALIYNEAFIVPERNYLGQDICYRLVNQYQYQKIIQFDKKIGVTTSGGPQGTRTRIVSSLETALIEKKLKIRSLRFVREMQTFIYDSKSGKAMHAPGETDDLLICAGLLSAYKDHIMRSMPVGYKPRTQDNIMVYDKEQESFKPILKSNSNEEQDLSWLFDN